MDKKKYQNIILIFLIIVSFFAYGRILVNDFINLDDNYYITDNNHIKSGINTESIKWAFLATDFYWHPLTWLSHMLGWRLFKGHAGGHHLISLLLHIGVVLFLFLFLNRTTKNLWLSAFAAAFFALHPLRVESVAWAAERKDVLSMFFGLASIYTYTFYAESHKFSKYFLCLILFAFSLMSKPLLVTLPFVLLLLDYWPLGRWQKALEGRERRNDDSMIEKEVTAAVNIRHHSIVMLLWEKVPFIFLTIVLSIVTFLAQNKGAVVPIGTLSFPIRVANALISYVSYLGKTFWPVDLAVFYPYSYPFPLWQILASCLILIGISVFVVCTVKKSPFLFVGWFWYLGTLIPVIGLVQVGLQAMADRHTYLPSVGIAIMLTWGISHVLRRGDISRKILLPAGITILIILSVLTWRQSGYWKSSIELFNHALRITKNNDQAHKNLASALAEEGKIEEAIDHYNTAIRLQPNSTDAYNNRGNIYIKTGQYYRAIEDYNEAIRLTKNDAELYYNRGVACYNLGQYQHAIDDYNRAIAINPSDGENYNNRGAAYTKLGQYQIAIEDFNKAIKLKPDYPDVYSNRAFVYFTYGDDRRGCLDAKKACDMGNCNTWNIAKKRKLCN